jgi:hypothetical protein
VKAKLMSKATAEQVLGRSVRKNELANMALALTFHPWANRPVDWLRLEAAVVLLGSAAPVHARRAIKAWKVRCAMAKAAA